MLKCFIDFRYTISKTKRTLFLVFLLLLYVDQTTRTSHVIFLQIYDTLHLMHIWFTWSHSWPFCIVVLDHMHTQTQTDPWCFPFVPRWSTHKVMCLLTQHYDILHWLFPLLALNLTINPIKIITYTYTL